MQGRLRFGGRTDGKLKFSVVGLDVIGHPSFFETLSEQLRHLLNAAIETIAFPIIFTLRVAARSTATGLPPHLSFAGDLVLVIQAKSKRAAFLTD